MLFRSLLSAERDNIEASLDAANDNIQAAQVALETAELVYKQTLSAALAAESATRTDLWDTSKPSEFDLPTWYFDKEERFNALQTEVDAALEAL